MIPKWNAGFFFIFPYNPSIFLVLFVTIKGDSQKQVILPAMVVANEFMVPAPASDSEPVITTRNISKIVTTTTTTATTSSMAGEEKILSRRRRYLVFPEGSSVQMGILWKMVFL